MRLQFNPVGDTAVRVVPADSAQANDLVRLRIACGVE
jgi:hypothetical protein